MGNVEEQFDRAYGGSKMVPRFLVEVLAKELGSRGITVNSIQPTAVSRAGVSAQGFAPGRPAIHRPVQSDATGGDLLR